MRDAIKSFNSLTLALTLFALKQAENVFYSSAQADGPHQATASMDSLTASAIQPLGGTLRATYDALNNLQQGIVTLAASILWPVGHQSQPSRHRNHVPETFDDSDIRSAADWPFDVSKRPSPPANTSIAARWAFTRRGRNAGSLREDAILMDARI